MRLIYWVEKHYYLFLLQIIKAPITPGIHPQSVRIIIIKNEPHPLSTTAMGGKMIHKITRQKLIIANLGSKDN